MPCYFLHHHHEPTECGPAFAAWKGFDSPLRRHVTFGSCLLGGHSIWWTVEAATKDDALALLPSFVAERTTLTPVSEVAIP
jgi:hypothetical protein